MARTLTLATIDGPERLARWLCAVVGDEGQAAMTGVAWAWRNAGGLPTGPAPTPPSGPVMALARMIADDVLRGCVPDPTGGANAWYEVWMMPPVWERRAQFRVQIGNYRFYYLGDH